MQFKCDFIVFIGLFISFVDVNLAFLKDDLTDPHRVLTQVNMLTRVTRMRIVKFFASWSIDLEFKVEDLGYFMFHSISRRIEPSFLFLVLFFSEEVIFRSMTFTHFYDLELPHFNFLTAFPDFQVGFSSFWSFEKGVKFICLQSWYITSAFNCRNSFLLFC